MTGRTAYIASYASTAFIGLVDTLWCIFRIYNPIETEQPEFMSQPSVGYVLCLVGLFMIGYSTVALLKYRTASKRHIKTNFR